MAYPPPPGLSSLPNRPPASTATTEAGPTSSSSPSIRSPPTAYPPAFGGGGGNNSSNGGGAGSARAEYGAPPATYGAHQPSDYGVNATPAALGAPAAPAAYGGGSYNHGSHYGGSSNQGYGRGGGGGGGGSHAAYGIPLIQNPFPAPSTVAAQQQQQQQHHQQLAANNYDPEMAAAIATWQSAYVTRDPTQGIQRTGTDASADGTGASHTPSGYGPEDPTSAAAQGAAGASTADGAGQERKKTVAREGGGKKWTDDSLLEWDPNHLRIFVGNLGGETTDNSLLSAFSRWSSVQKARVIRDKRTNKSRGYGFVSFSDADDFFSAAKEMNGKYIGSHPVVIRKANTEIKVVRAKDKDGGGGGGGRNNNNRNKNNKNKSGSGGAGRDRDEGGDAYEPSHGPMNPTRVTKPGQKTKNGLRLLG
jgi:hypothetical protein